MPLPTLSVPEYEIKLPSKQKKIRIRPFLAKEQKILLMAIESEDEEQMYSAIIKILKDCILTTRINVEKLPTFDLEYLMVQLRIRSVDDVSTIRFLPPERAEELKEEEKEPTEDDYIDITLNLNDINIDVPKDHNIIKLREDTTLEMNYPNLGLLSELKSLSGKSEVERMFNIIARLIDTIYKDDEAFPFKDATKQEQIKFVEQMSTEDLTKMNSFLETIPSLKHTIEYTYKDEKKTLTLNGLQDFFAFASPTLT